MMPSIRLSAVFVGLFCIVLGATAVHAADAFSVKVEGLQGDLKSNVEAPWVSALLPSKGAIEHECAAGYAPDCGLWVITIRS